MRLVRRNLAAHRRSNLLSRSRGISMTSALGSWSPRYARPQRTGRFKGPPQICRRSGGGSKGAICRAADLRRLLRPHTVPSGINLCIRVSVALLLRRSFFALGSLVPRWQPRRDCSARGGQAKQSHRRLALFHARRASQAQCLDMRSKISIGRYCAHGQWEHNNEAGSAQKRARVLQITSCGFPSADCELLAARSLADGSSKYFSLNKKGRHFCRPCFCWKT